MCVYMYVYIYVCVYIYIFNGIESIELFITCIIA